MNLSKKLIYIAGCVLLLGITVFFSCLPSETREFQIERVEFLDKSGKVEIANPIVPKIKSYIRINDTQVILRNNHSTIDEYVVDSITSYQDVKEIRWSNNTIIILLEEVNTVLIETSGVIEKYKVKRVY